MYKFDYQYFKLEKFNEVTSVDLFYASKLNSTFAK